MCKHWRLHGAKETSINSIGFEVLQCLENNSVIALFIQLDRLKRIPGHLSSLQKEHFDIIIIFGRLKIFLLPIPAGGGAKIQPPQLLTMKR